MQIKTYVYTYILPRGKLQVSACVCVCMFGVSVSVSVSVSVFVRECACLAFSAKFTAVPTPKLNPKLDPKSVTPEPKHVCTGVGHSALSISSSLLALVALFCCTYSCSILVALRQCALLR
jgi:hypothetical protein